MFFKDHYQPRSCHLSKLRCFPVTATSLKKKWSSPQVGSLEDLRVASAGKLWRYYVGLCQKEGEEKEQKEGDEKEKGEEEQHPFNPAFRLTFN